MSGKKEDKKDAAPEAGAEGEAAPKPKSKMLLIIILVVVAIILMGGSAFGALYFTGFFKPKPALPAAAAEANEDGEMVKAKEGAAGEGHAGAEGEKGSKEGEGGKEGEKGEKGEKGKEGKEGKESKKIPDKEKFEATYKEIEKDFTLNVHDSRKFVQFKVAYKTFYGDKIVQRVTKHELPIRASIINTVDRFSEDELSTSEGRERLQIAIRNAINDVLIRNEDFGGIEEVMFTHFVFQ
jgi:flagellar protein FliL